MSRATGLLCFLRGCLAGAAVVASGCGGGGAAGAPAASSRVAAADPPAITTVAHALHGGDTPIRAALACAECHLCPGPAPAWGALATASGAAPAWDAATRTCSGVYCHGAKLKSPPATAVAWTAAEPDWSAPASRLCAGCHGYPPPAPHPQHVTGCSGCHASTVRADGTIDVAGGHHVDGRVDFVGGAGLGCAGCHAFPPPTGAHAAHFGLADAAATGEYGDTSVLQDRLPGVDPVFAPTAYAFGCGSCHPLDPAKHMDGRLDVELADATAPAGSLKARAAPGAAWDAVTGTCSGTYCHSSGQEQPQYASTPSWRAPVKLGCGGCHSNPPVYASGDAGSATANSHLALDANGREWGHFLGEGGPRHGPYHGGIVAGRDAAPITCQTCHFGTVSPASTGASGFYWLDTTGSYRLPGGDPARLTTARYVALDCTVCHGSGGPAPAAAGRVLPLRHVNGARDVVFDPRTTLPASPGLPAAPNRPTRPYWLTGARASEWTAGVGWDGTTVSFALDGAAYDPSTKTCSGVACHRMRPAVWGTQYTCAKCHTIHQGP